MTPLDPGHRSPHGIPMPSLPLVSRALRTSGHSPSPGGFLDYHFVVGFHVLWAAIDGQLQQVSAQYRLQGLQAGRYAVQYGEHCTRPGSYPLSCARIRRVLSCVYICKSSKPISSRSLHSSHKRQSMGRPRGIGHSTPLWLSKLATSCRLAHLLFGYVRCAGQAFNKPSRVRHGSLDTRNLRHFDPRA